MIELARRRLKRSKAQTLTNPTIRQTIDMKLALEPTTTQFGRPPAQTLKRSKTSTQSIRRTLRG
jgi:hypothetical protein